MTLSQNINQYGKVTSFLAENNARIFQLHTDKFDQANLSQFQSAYMNNTYWQLGLAYPVCHLLRLICDLGSLFQGLTLLLQLQTTSNDALDTSALQEKLYNGLRNNAIAIGLDILNIIVSAIAFITKSFVTLMYGIRQDPATTACRDFVAHTFFASDKITYVQMRDDLSRGNAEELELLARSLIPFGSKEDHYLNSRESLGFSKTA